jgi:hypothetical protein
MAIPSPTSGPRLPPKSSVKSHVRNKCWNHNTSGGASLPLIGALLGHASPSTTHRYAHLFDDPQRAAAEKVGAVIAAAGKDAKAGEDMVETFPEGGRRGR